MTTERERERERERGREGGRRGWNKTRIGKDYSMLVIGANVCVATALIDDRHLHISLFPGWKRLSWVT